MKFHFYEALRAATFLIAISALPAFAAEDYASPLGFLLRKSCFERRDRSEVIAHYETAMKALMKQTELCTLHTGFPIANTGAKIAVTLDIECNDFDGDRYPICEADTVVRKEGSIDVPAGVYWAGFDRHRGIRCNRFKNMDLREDMVDFAATLFHESIHFTSTMQRIWHSDRSLLGCEKSGLNDRVIFFTAACFPQSTKGKMLYGFFQKVKLGDKIVETEFKAPLLECPSLCINSLRDPADAELVKAYKNIYGGQNLLAKPFSPGDTDIFCSRIKELAQASKTFQTDKERSREKLSPAQNKVLDFLGL